MSQAVEMNIILADADGSDEPDTNPILLAARNCDLGSDETFAYNTGKRGTRQQYSCGARKVRDVVSGGFDFYPTEVSLDWIIQRFIGDNISGFPTGAATPKETPVTFVAAIDKGYDNFRITKLCITELILSITEGDLISCRVNCVGSREYNGYTWPTLSPAPTLDCGDCCAAADCVLSVGGTAYSLKNGTLNINNNMPDIIENAMYRTRYEYGAMSVGLNATLGYRSDTAAMYRRGIAGDAAYVEFNTGSKKYTWTIANLKAPGQKIVVPEDGEITIPFTGTGLRTSGAQQLSIAKANV